MRQKRFFSPGISALIAATLCTLIFTTETFGGEKAHAKYFAYVGTYTDGASKGIYAYEYDARTKKTQSLGLAAETTNPSFVAVDKAQHFLYAVNEIQKYDGKVSGGVSAFAIDSKTGKLTFLNEVASLGADPCYISLDKTGKYVLVANYTSGNVAVFPIMKDGKLGDSTGFVQHTGTGPNHERQEGPHAHWVEVTSDNRYAVVSDLGLDELLVYHFDAGKGQLAANDPAFTKVEPGAGPRHFAFHPNGKFAYVVDEMKSTVNAFTFDAEHGVLKMMQTVSTLPAGFAGKNDTAELEIHPSGRFVYASNRGNDSIAVYSVNAKTGMLTLVEHTPTGGKTPRSFEIDPTGTRLFAANQESGTINVFSIDSKSGKLTATREVLQVAAPVCVKFAAAE